MGILDILEWASSSLTTATFSVDRSNIQLKKIRDGHAHIIPEFKYITDTFYPLFNWVLGATCSLLVSPILVQHVGVSDRLRRLKFFVLLDKVEEVWQQMDQAPRRKDPQTDEIGVESGDRRASSAILCRCHGIASISSSGERRDDCRANGAEV
ncbi:hypothetical protein SELMODRAFT_420706 [Selaginella moellendorffii]|uniref:Uncharacterized protein n=1 Tax=Selaginella moellendorffii TaxID=88036 RepID=D8SCV1_SELML|nr:hypothetical protein SELMODRAFT_420706 [Selaginella moellendorffii]